MMSERPAPGGGSSGGGGGGGGGGDAGVSIGNYKGVMLCNRPFAGTGGVFGSAMGGASRPSPSAVVVLFVGSGLARACRCKVPRVASHALPQAGRVELTRCAVLKCVVDCC